MTKVKVHPEGNADHVSHHTRQNAWVLYSDVYNAIQA